MVHNLTENARWNSKGESTMGMSLVILYVERKQSETKWTGYFGYMIQSVSLPRIRKEWTLPAVTQIV